MTQEIKLETEYELHYGYHGTCSAHYTLCGIKSISFAKKKLDELLEQSGCEYAYIIKIEKTKLL